MTGAGVSDRTGRGARGAGWGRILRYEVRGAKVCGLLASLEADAAAHVPGGWMAASWRSRAASSSFSDMAADNGAGGARAADSASPSTDSTAIDSVPPFSTAGRRPTAMGDASGTTSTVGTAKLGPASGDTRATAWGGALLGPAKLGLASGEVRATAWGGARSTVGTAKLGLASAEAGATACGDGLPAVGTVNLGLPPSTDSATVWEGATFTAGAARPEDRAKASSRGAKAMATSSGDGRGGRGGGRRVQGVEVGRAASDGTVRLVASFPLARGGRGGKARRRSIPDPGRMAVISGRGGAGGDGGRAMSCLLIRTPVPSEKARSTRPSAILHSIRRGDSLDTDTDTWSDAVQAQEAGWSNGRDGGRRA